MVGTAIGRVDTGGVNDSAAGDIDLSRISNDNVVASITIDGVRTESADQDIGSGITRDRVIAELTGNSSVIRSDYVDGGTGDRDLRLVANNNVLVTIARECISAGATDDDILAGVAVDRIAATGSRCHRLGHSEGAGAAGYGVGELTVVTEQHVVTSLAADRVLPGPAEHGVGEIGGSTRIAGGVAVNDVVAAAAKGGAGHRPHQAGVITHDIGIVANEDVGAGIAADSVTGKPADNDIVTIVTEKRVNAAIAGIQAAYIGRHPTAGKDGGTAVAEECVAGSVAMDGVAAKPAKQGVYVLVTVDRVGTELPRGIGRCDIGGDTAGKVQNTLITDYEVASEVTADRVTGAAAQQDVVIVVALDGVCAAIGSIDRFDLGDVVAGSRDLAKVTEDIVVAVIAEQRVPVTTAKDIVCAAMPFDRVGAADRGVFCFVVGRDRATVAEQDIVAAVAIQLVVAGIPEQPIVTAAAVKHIVVGTAVNHIVRTAIDDSDMRTDDSETTGAFGLISVTKNRVIAGVAEQQVGSDTAKDRVVARTPVDRVDIAVRVVE